MNEIGFVARPGRVEDEVAEGGQLVRAAELLQLHISSEVAPYVTPVTLETLLGEMLLGLASHLLRDVLTRAQPARRRAVAATTRPTAAASRTAASSRAAVRTAGAGPTRAQSAGRWSIMPALQRS